MAEGGTCRDTERSRLSKRNSLPRNGKGRDLSGHGKELTEREALTSWRWQREGLVRTLKETDQARGTHFLGTAEGGTCQDTERDRLSKGCSRAADGRGWDLSGHRKKQTEWGALTNWGWEREGLVRTQKETEEARGTHILKTAEGGTCQDMERNQPSEGYSQTGDGRGMDLS
jgi:hypothetical protein